MSGASSCRCTWTIRCGSSQPEGGTNNDGLLVECERRRTADAGYLDARGRLWLLGRCSARANDSEGVLYPLAVECAAGAMPGVGRTAFVMRRQQRLLAAEVEGDVAAVRAELMERLAWAKLADVVIVPRIPMDRRHNAKVEYPALLQLLDRARSPDIS